MLEVAHARASLGRRKSFHRKPTGACMPRIIIIVTKSDARTEEGVATKQLMQKNNNNKVYLRAVAMQRASSYAHLSAIQLALTMQLQTD